MTRIDMAPMEGVTNYIFRQVFHRHYGGVDRFYTPFLSPNQNKQFITREWNEIDPAHNEGLTVLPQLLTRNQEHFLWACGELEALGYDQVNLNLGCPSGTVVAKKKGSGFLTVPEELDSFFQEVFSKTSLHISVKTRLGKQDPAEFHRILEIFNRYPICELTVHPRVQKEFYRGPVHRDAFAYAAAHAKSPLCYNGDLFSVPAFQAIQAEYPHLRAVMLGRGLVANPALAEEARGTGRRDLNRLRAFHDDLYEQYCRVLSGDRSILSRMKEVWAYQLPMFTHWEDSLKPLRKAEHRRDYEAVVNRLFRQEQLTEGDYCS